MASSYTSNYNLCQWEASDKVLRTEFNADNAKIDAALSAKADISALNSLRSTVNGKVSKAELNALSQTVTSQGTSLERRNCTVHLSAYTGTGADTRTFTFSSQPFAVFFDCGNGNVVFALRGARYATNARNTSAPTVELQWNGNSVAATKAEYINSSNYPYTLLAFLEL